MSAGRRTFLTAVGGGVLGTVATGHVRSESRVTIRGDVVSASGGSIENKQIEIYSPDLREGERAYVENGVFETSVPANATYQLTFFNRSQSGGYNTERNGVPLVYGLDDDVQVGEEDIDVGTYEIPAAFVVDLRFENMDGNPVRDLPISFRAMSTGSGMGPNRASTNSVGRVTQRGSSDPGVELVDSVGVDIHPMDSEVSPTQVDQLMVTEDIERRIPVRDPEQYGGVVVDSDSETDDSAATFDDGGDGSDGGDDASIEAAAADSTDDSEPADADAEAADGPDRGFFTNDPESSFAFLNDPVRLTWAGILVSIAGIVAQLLGRQG